MYAISPRRGNANSTLDICMFRLAVKVSGAITGVGRGGEGGYSKSTRPVA